MFWATPAIVAMVLTKGWSCEDALLDPVLGPVVATGGPSPTRPSRLAGARISWAYVAGPWAICYTDHGIGSAGLGVVRRDVAGEIRRSAPKVVAREISQTT